MAIELISKIKPKNGASYPMVDAKDVAMPDGTRLSDFQQSVMSSVQIVAMTQDKYYEMQAAGTLEPNTAYLIVSDTA